jgi:hypothetical protein
LVTKKIPRTDTINYQFPGECQMIITDLNVMESVEGAAVIGGSGGKTSRSVTVKRNFKTTLDNSLKSKVDVDGNFASGSFSADAVGRDTFTDGYVKVKTTPGSSHSSGGAVAATGGGKGH